jgi:hypothetical protein
MSVIFANSLKEIQTSLRRLGGIDRYIFIQDCPESAAIKYYLSSTQHSLEIDTSEICIKNSEYLRREYVNFIARLNVMNSSFSWWILEFPSKMPLDSQLCERTINFLVISKLIEEKDDRLLVILEDRTLVKQLRQSYKHIKIIDALSKKIRLKEAIQRYVFILPLVYFIRIIFFKLFSMFLFSPKLDSKSSYYVIRSLLSEKSFDKEGNYSDIFLGKLGQFLITQGKKCIVLATIMPPFLNNIIKIRKKYKNPDIVIIPYQCFLSLYDMFLSLFYSFGKLFSHFSIKGETKICGRDISYLVKMSLIENLSSHKYFLNLLSFHSMRVFAKKIQIERFFYPFENRAWERAMLYALRETRADIKIIGYQHSAISLRHLNYMLGDSGQNTIPLPDKVITSGQITKDILREIGNFPEKILRVGCALRQQKLFHTGLKVWNKKISNILMVLNYEDYSRMDFLVDFLNKSFADTQNRAYKFFIRPHPLYPLKKIESHLSALRFEFDIDRDKNIYESIRKADVILYSSSTTAVLEAISMGIPVVYIHLGVFLNPDPLFNFAGLKWTVYHPERLLGVMQDIETQLNDRAGFLQAEARSFFLNYFSPAQNLQVFLE